MDDETQYQQIKAEKIGGSLLLRTADLCELR